MDTSANEPTLDVFAQALERLRRLGKEAQIGGELINLLSAPKATLQASLPVRMDDGSLRCFAAFRSRYNDTLGPTKGGIRFHPQVSREEVMALALWMTIKTAVVGLPYGGGKGGVVVDPKALSPMELERLSRAYVRAMADFIGPDTDIPAPDVYTNARIMGWMMDEYETIHRRKSAAVITGKPVRLGGSLGRDEATGRGAYLCIRELAKKRQIVPQDTTVAIQGFGNAGYHVARLLQADGYRIVAVSDSKGAIYTEKSGGFDIESLQQHKTDTRQLRAVYCAGSVCELVEHQSISNAELLQLDVDILIPAALEQVITEDNIDAIKAPIIVEVANGPVVSSVDRILNDRGTTVIPDVLANAGGVTVSYFEWVQNKAGYYWTLEQVRERLEKLMVGAFDDIWAIATDEKRSLRGAAYAHALRRIEEGALAQGSQAYFGADRAPG